MIGTKPLVLIESGLLILRQILIQTNDRVDIIFQISWDELLTFLDAEKFVNHGILLLVKISHFGIGTYSRITATAFSQFLGM